MTGNLAFVWPLVLPPEIWVCKKASNLFKIERKKQRLALSGQLSTQDYTDDRPRQEKGPPNENDAAPKRANLFCSKEAVKSPNSAICAFHTP